MSDFEKRTSTTVRVTRSTVAMHTVAAEIEAMLGPLPVEVRRQPDDLDVDETGATYLENASLKASAAATRTNHWALADDSGLEVDALQGAPGLLLKNYKYI